MPRINRYSWSLIKNHKHQTISKHPISKNTAKIVITVFQLFNFILQHISYSLNFQVQILFLQFPVLHHQILQHISFILQVQILAIQFLDLRLEIITQDLQLRHARPGWLGFVCNINSSRRRTEQVAPFINIGVISLYNFWISSSGVFNLYFEK